MSAAVLSAMTLFEDLVNCFFGIVPMLWLNHRSIPHAEKKRAKPDKRVARSSRRKLLFRPELLEMFGITAPTIWLWQQKLSFPHAIIVGGRSAWYADEVDAWIASRPRRRIKGDAEEGEVPTK